jgi:hypothetical protein
VERLKLADMITEGMHKVLRQHRVRLKQPGAVGFTLDHVNPMAFNSLFRPRVDDRFPTTRLYARAAFSPKYFKPHWDIFCGE